MREQARGRRAIRDHRGRGAPHDSRLLSADRFAVVAEPILMIEVDAHDQRAVGIYCIDRIQAAAHANLQNRDVGFATREVEQRRDRGRLEIRQSHGAERVLDAAEKIDELLVGRVLAVEPDTLVESPQVRRRKRTDIVTCVPIDALEHRHARSFPIRARNGNDLVRRVEQIEVVQHLDQSVER